MLIIADRCASVIAPGDRVRLTEFPTFTGTVREVVPAATPNGVAFCKVLIDYTGDVLPVRTDRLTVEAPAAPALQAVA